MSTPLAGKIALVTGSSRGIGRGIASALARSGADVVVTYRKSEDQAKACADQLRSLGRRAWVRQLEMGDIGSIDALFEWLQAEVKVLDICILNAAATSFRPLMTAEPRHLQRTYAISVFGFLRALQRSFPMIEARGGGTIIGISGIDTVTWVPNHGILAGAKAAMESLISYFAAENGRSGVTIMGVSPGPVPTNSLNVMFGDRAEGLMQAGAAAHPRGTIASIEDIAEAVAMFCTPAGRWAHGATVRIDGGEVFTSYGRWMNGVMSRLEEDGSD